ncbi:hypothetical protein FO519_007968 [Halicephalobus sp. NKZ332]|nr:hypothetical protein FO519_007968 [Halicephalobus sp. NKZ332]
MKILFRLLLFLTLLTLCYCLCANTGNHCTDTGCRLNGGHCNSGCVCMQRTAPAELQMLMGSDRFMSL